MGSYREFLLLEKHSEAPFVKLLDKGSPPFIQGDGIHACDSLGVCMRATRYFAVAKEPSVLRSVIYQFTRKAKYWACQYFF